MYVDYVQALVYKSAVTLIMNIVLLGNIWLFFVVVAGITFFLEIGFFFFNLSSLNELKQIGYCDD